MNRVFVSFPIINFDQIKWQVLNWAARFNGCCFLDNHEYPSNFSSHECLVGAGILKSLEAPAGNALGQLRDFSRANDDWLFGHFGFDLKNETESVPSAHGSDRIQFPDLFFFVPEIIIELDKHAIHIGSYGDGHAAILDQIREIPCSADTGTKKRILTKPGISREEYIATIGKLREHILRGDCYEINFCQEFYAESVSADPLQIYRALSKISPMPFAAFYKLDDKYLICASPERYLKRSGDLLLSQPIKGTWPRNKNDPGLDEVYRDELFFSAKDRSENVMVVDLVRNDLSRVCEEGSVKVDELYGIYSFPQVHQMISTLSGKPRKGKDWLDMIAATFPMGSMTGAPKKRVLEIIARYEKTRRGLFSGAVGYVSPARDFDFNVVIRSILFNQTRKCLSYQVGSGITFYSNAEKEYEECLLKAAAMEKALMQEL